MAFAMRPASAGALRSRSAVSLRPQSAGPCVLHNAYAMELAKRTQSKDSDDALERDWDYLLELVTVNPEGLKHASEDLLKDREFIRQAVALNGLALQFADKEFRDDREIVLGAVSQNGLALKFMGDALGHDFAFTLEAIELNAEAIVGATDYWHGDPELLVHASPKLKDDRDFVLYMVRHRGVSLRSASRSMQADKDVVYAAVKSDGKALQYAAPSLQKHAQIVRAAVCQNGLALEFAATEPRDNMGIVMAAIANNPFSLEFASEKLRSDVSIAIFAVKRDIHALKFAGPDVLADKSFIQMVMKFDGIGLQYVDPRLQADVETVVYAVQSNWEAKQFASKAALKSKLVQKAIARARRLAERESPIGTSAPSFVSKFRSRFTEKERAGDVGDVSTGTKNTKTTPSKLAATIVEQTLAKIPTAPQRIFSKAQSRVSIRTQDTAERAKVKEQGDISSSEVMKEFEQDNLARTRATTISRDRPSSAPAAINESREKTIHDEYLGEDLGDTFPLLKRLRAQKQRPHTAPVVRPASATRVQPLTQRQKAAVINARLAQGMHLPQEQYPLSTDPVRRDIQMKVLAGRPMSAASKFTVATTASGIGIGTSRPSSAEYIFQEGFDDSRVSSKRPQSAKPTHFGAEIGWMPSNQSEDEERDRFEVLEEGKRPHFKSDVSRIEYVNSSDTNSREVRPSLAPPVPSFSGNILEAEITETCAAAVMIDGVSSNPACRGTYVRTDLVSDGNGGRAIFKGPGAKYLFYWADVNKWLVGDDYTSKKAWVCSSHSETWCPTQVSTWKEWDGDSKAFRSVDALTVRKVRHLATGTTEPNNVSNIEVRSSIPAVTTLPSSIEVVAKITQEQADEMAKERIAELEDQLSQALAAQRIQANALQEHMKKNYTLEDTLANSQRMEGEHQQYIAKLERQVEPKAALIDAESEKSQSSERQVEPKAALINAESEKSLSSSEFSFLLNEHARLLASPSQNVLPSDLPDLIAQGIHFRAERAQLQEEQHKLMQQVAKAESLQTEETQSQDLVHMRLLDNSPRPTPSSKPTPAIHECDDPRSHCSETDSTSTWDFFQEEHARLLADPSQENAASELAALMSEGDALHCEHMLLQRESARLQGLMLP